MWTIRQISCRKIFLRPRRYGVTECFSLAPTATAAAFLLPNAVRSPSEFMNQPQAPVNMALDLLLCLMNSLGLCREIQFAADAEWPHDDPANAGIRAEFQLPPDRVMK